MRTVQFLVYAGIALVAYCDEHNIPVIPAFWHYLTRFFSWLSGVTWRAGLATQSLYTESMENYCG